MKNNTHSCVSFNPCTIRKFITVAVFLKSGQVVEVKLRFLTSPHSSKMDCLLHTRFFCGIVHLLIIHQLYKCCREEHRDSCQGVLVTFLATLCIHSTPSTRCSAVAALLQRCCSSVAALLQLCRRPVAVLLQRLHSVHTLSLPPRLQAPESGGR